MAEKRDNAPTGNRVREWTVMFFFAGDNALSPLIVSQVKAIKDAGFQRETDVLLYFDSNEKGVPTRLFNVNQERKGYPPSTHIGDGKDPYVRNMIEDEIVPAKINAAKGPGAAAFGIALKKPDMMTASKALESFITYCRENHRAKHYLLFLVGHGMIVANDTFLFDENPGSAITLVQLGNILQRFTKKVKKDGGIFEMLALHSCSMSAIEVAYELKDTANYMMASEGISFVGSWPYRQLLKKTFNTTEKVRKKRQGLNAKDDVHTLLEKLYELSLYNATDFAFSGYSLDLSLCSLANDKIARLMNALRRLTARLKKSLDNPKRHGLHDESGKPSELELILLAHLRSQSYWQEDYTDLYDFCRCLRDSCNAQDRSQQSLAEVCKNVMDVLEQNKNSFDGLVVHSDNFGWEYQYSHGLSIYFPWSKPIGDVNKSPVKNYKKYAFTTALGKDSWLSFLEKYWEKTTRPSENPTPSPFFDMIVGSQNSGIFGSLNKAGGSYGNKPGGGYGDTSCTCPSIKNYPTTVKLGRRIRVFSMTKKVEGAFKRRV